MVREHPFYILPTLVQGVLAAGLAVLAVLPLFSVLYDPRWVLAAPVFAFWGFFATTPALRFVGFYRYYSPYLSVMWPTRRRLDIHLGTPFDRLLTMRWSDRGRVARFALLGGALDGLIAIANDVESGRLRPDVVVEGTSWFFSPRTARRFGFSLAEPDWFHEAIAWLIVLDIVLVYSFTRGRLAWPRFAEVRRAVTTGTELLANRGRLVAFRDRLARIRLAPSE